jgi:hypothetical protein
MAAGTTLQGTHQCDVMVASGSGSRARATAVARWGTRDDAAVRLGTLPRADAAHPPWCTCCQGTELRATLSCDTGGKSVESLVAYGKVGARLGLGRPGAAPRPFRKPASW